MQLTQCPTRCVYCLDLSLPLPTSNVRERWVHRPLQQRRDDCLLVEEVAEFTSHDRLREQLVGSRAAPSTNKGTSPVKTKQRLLREWEKAARYEMRLIEDGNKGLTFGSSPLWACRSSYARGFACTSCRHVKQSIMRYFHSTCSTSSACGPVYDMHLPLHSENSAIAPHGWLML